MSNALITKDQVYLQLKKCMDPEIPVNIVDLGLVYDIEINKEKDVDIKMTMTTRGCPLHNTMVNDVKKYVSKINGVGNINVEIVWDPPWSIDKMDPKAREMLGFGKPKLRFQIDYEKALPKKIGSFQKSEDGSLILINKDERSYMVNDAIVRFWESCDGTKTINQLTDYFSEKLGIPRQQVEQEVVQLLEQLFDAELIQV
ncbi:MAG TPA: PqqD family peptide modification chaperone [Nitrososphaeraceae archaeon]|jgi:metal-sulfur cluster biosynthetic enzyme|nr:PqqD family peptide modification chaperone [Nitrososphaeraceae archaeon]HEU5172673.1 PqqD family peptide modification chaperone [Nitrososphaeraceae archaeon]